MSIFLIDGTAFVLIGLIVLIALVVGLSQCGADTVRLAAIARIATIAMVLGINVSQLRQGWWKRPPLYVITAVLGLVAAGYVRVVFSSP